MDHLQVSDVRKIAVLRTNQGVGDLLVCLPAIRSLKAAYPHAEIVWLGLSWHERFLCDRPTGIDRLIEVPPSLQLRNLNQKMDRDETAFFEDLRREAFDIAINFQAEEDLSYYILQQLNARCIIGQSMSLRQLYDRSIPYTYYQHEIIRHIHLVRLLGANDVTLSPTIELHNWEKEEAERLILELAMEKPFVLLHPGATDMRRRWPTSKFATVADELIEKGFDILLAGDERDAPIIQDVIQQMNGKAYVLYDGIALGVLAALQTLSQLVISNDTGPLHLARSVSCPTIGLYWAPNVINWGPLNQDRHIQLISWDLPCPSCGIIPNRPYPFEPKSAQCQHLHSFIRTIAVADVLDAAHRLLFTARPYVNQIGC